MKEKRILCLAAAGVAAVCLLMQGCAALSDIMGAMSNLKRLQFRLDGIRGFTVAGIDISRKQRLMDFSLADGARLLSAFRGRSLPTGFFIDVEAVNPNDGTGGSPKTVSTLTRFDWRLLIDGQTTIAGGIDRPIEIPGTGHSTIIPLRMEIDLFEFFGRRGYDDVIDLALALGGLKHDISRISLDAQPFVTTPLGEIAYPGHITIVSFEFR